MTTNLVVLSVLMFLVTYTSRALGLLLPPILQALLPLVTPLF